MGEIAARGCDLAIITSDNPRSEAPLTIIEQILKGTRRITTEALRLSDLGPGGIPAKGYVVEPDRQAAIEAALRISQPGDTVLIAGKGHETYQIIGGRRIPFDDRLVARDALLRAAPGSADA
jgi:UDP-N-acetylmuramyl tripeptide synthase